MTQQLLIWEPWMGILIAFTESGMTQGQFAARLGWDPSKVSRTLTGKRDVSAKELQDIIGILGHNWGWYMSGARENSGLRVLGLQTQPVPQLALAS